MRGGAEWAAKSTMHNVEKMQTDVSESRVKIIGPTIHENEIYYHCILANGLSRDYFSTFSFRYDNE